MKTPHKHAELIKQWADGATIEILRALDGSWAVSHNPLWDKGLTYRVKPEPALSQTAQDMVNELVEMSAAAEATKHSVYGHIANATDKRNACTAKLHQYILTLEQAILNPKTD